MSTTTRPAAPVAATAPARRLGPTRLALRQGRLEIRQFLRSRESVVFTLGFPLIMVLIFASIFDEEIAPGVSYTQYFITGMIATGLMTVSFQNLGIWIPIERDRGVLKRYLGTPMPKWVWFAGKVLMVLVIGVAMTALLLAVSVTLFDLNLPTDATSWLTFGWVCALGITACTLCGIAISSLARTARSGSAVVTPIALVLQFISGVFFVFTNLPSWMQQVAAIFPLKWMCQGLRAVFLPESFGADEPGGSFELTRVALVLGVWCVIGLVLCLTTFRWTTRRDG
ncbi:ABC-2 type transport system permease protein [Micromonospora phaseoli]|uniref:Transport permease protein n=1 Tax=Micromonospora phaseoli TaxID=1144548 RepID=A0A1H6WQH9_9ACTN|nr:ABC transporter permease [Micromonospora phaseoli]PZW01753.1 ABC-2 type transport system permease protein [Micromonospora phaseoli]GIJ80871.1 transport permease protein [Micromonospora phaseoli]SEJ14722.1 ABC-2 type transport system permease protein [Micromonospora phaseoli]